MAGFNAETAVEKLDWTFKPFVDAEGTIPEPSDKQVDVFWAEIGRVTKAATRTEAAEKLSTLDDDAEADAELAQKVNADVAAAFADLCQSCPTVEQIQGLPARHKQAFYGWVVGQLANPE